MAAISALGPKAPVNLNRPVVAGPLLGAAPQAKTAVAPPITDLNQVKVPAQGKIPTTLLNVSFDLNQGFVKNVNGQFSLNGKPFRYVGTNMYSLAREKPETQEKMLKDAAEAGFTVVRFWASETYGATTEGLQQLCDLAKKYNLKLIPCLADRWVMSEQERHGDQWFKSGYKEKYLPRVLEMTSQLKDRPEIMIWELINEPESESFEAMYNFTSEVSSAIKAQNPNQMISLGTIGGIGDKFGSQLSRLSTDNFKKLYAIPTLDAASIHDYSYDSTVLERLDILYRFSGETEKGKSFGKADQVLSWMSRKVDNAALDLLGTQLQRPWTLRGIWDNMNNQNIEDAKALKKPLYIGEVGFKQSHGDDRQKLLKLDISRAMDKGVQGYTLWSFEAQNRSIDGHDYGFREKDNFAPIVKAWNSHFAEQATGQASKAPAGDNFSLLHQAGQQLKSGMQQTHSAIQHADQKLGGWVPDLLYGWLK